MENHVFPDPAVAGQLKLMVEARIHNDAVDTQDEIRAWQDSMIHTLATPSYALIDPKSGKLVDSHDGPERDPEIFAAWLAQAHAKWKASN